MIGTDVETREVIYLDAAGNVVEIAVVGDADPNDISAIYGYADWVDKVDAPYVGVGWGRVGEQWRPPQPFPSWSWDGEQWQPPTPCPPEGHWYWDEASQEWIEIKF